MLFLFAVQRYFFHSSVVMMIWQDGIHTDAWTRPKPKPNRGRKMVGWWWGKWKSWGAGSDLHCLLAMSAASRYTRHMCLCPWRSFAGRLVARRIGWRRVAVKYYIKIKLTFHLAAFFSNASSINFAMVSGGVVSWGDLRFSPFIFILLFFFVRFFSIFNKKSLHRQI